MDKKITARNEYTCNACNQPIRKGSLYYYGSGKFPRYENDKQVGFEYATWRLHINCPVTPWYLQEEENIAIADISDCSPDPASIPQSEHYLHNHTDDLPF